MTFTELTTAEELTLIRESILKLESTSESTFVIVMTTLAFLFVMFLLFGLRWMTKKSGESLSPLSKLTPESSLFANKHNVAEHTHPQTYQESSKDIETIQAAVWERMRNTVVDKVENDGTNSIDMAYDLADHFADLQDESGVMLSMAICKHIVQREEKELLDHVTHHKDLEKGMDNSK